MGISNSINDSDIAIIGMAGRFPGASDVDAFWRNLRDGVESISFFSDQELLDASVSLAQILHKRFIVIGAARINSINILTLFFKLFSGFNDGGMLSQLLKLVDKTLSYPCFVSK